MEALYLSLVKLATLGFGDIVPTSGPLRVLVPFEALIGFGLFTAAVSWLLSIYPALSRRQVLAHEANLVRESEREVGSVVEELSADAADRLLASLTSQLLTVEGDLVQFPVTYYFHNSDERIALPGVMPYLVRLAESAGRADQPPELRFRATMLHDAIDDFSSTVASYFLDLPPSSSTDDVLAAYARDQRHAPDKGAQWWGAPSPARRPRRRPEVPLRAAAPRALRLGSRGALFCSFPSGRAVTAVSFRGGLATLAARCFAGWRRWAIAVTGAVLILLVGFGRLYFGGHYASDATLGNLAATV